MPVIRAYTKGLVNAGHLQREGETFSLVRDIGVDAPRVRDDGRRVTVGARREQIWRTLKILVTSALMIWRSTPAPRNTR